MTTPELKKKTSALKLLYVEDSKILHKATLKLFEQFFGKVDSAYNGKEGLALFTKNKYDLVVTDINMPELDGIEMLKQIKVINPKQEAMVTSSHFDPKSIAELVDIDVKSLVVKPRDLKKVIDALLDFILSYKIVDEANCTPLDEQFELLELLEQKLNSTIYAIQMEGDLSDTLKEQLLSTIDQYAIVLSDHEEYKHIAKEFYKLIESIENSNEDFNVKLNTVTNMLEDFVKNMSPWRHLLCDKAFETVLLKSSKKIIALLRAY